MVIRFSANLGFLWKELALPDAIRAAALAGFDAVECHWPYQFEKAQIRDALSQSGLEMLSLNTHPGDVENGDFGLAALPGRESEARNAIDAALDYAAGIGCRNVHVMAGIAGGPAARQTFLDNLTYASRHAASANVNVLIEPINVRDVPGYFLSSITDAIKLILSIDANNLKLLFDCYHVRMMEQEVLTALEDALPYLGHVQFAGFPGRGRPDTGSIDYQEVFLRLSQLGWDYPLGAEYLTDGRTEETLGWLDIYRTNRHPG